MDYTSAFSQMFSNHWLWLAVLLAVIFQVAVVYIPTLNTAFGTTPLSIKDWVTAVGLASLVLWGEEVKKLMMRAIGFEKRNQTHSIRS